MKTDTVNKVAAIMWANEAGVIQSELRSYPHDHADEAKRGVAITEPEELEAMAIEFRELNPDAKRVWIRLSETTDYYL